MKIENKIFPGRDNYTGPTEGYFGLLHHDTLFEFSHDVMERVAYVKGNKSSHEIAIRLYNMIYLPFAIGYFADYDTKRAPLNVDYDTKRASLDADYETKCASLDADYKTKRVLLDADYKAKCAALDVEIISYIKAHIPDCAWDGKELVFSKQEV